MLDPTAFKAYDVRALYPSQLDEAGAYAVGRAFAEQFEPRRIAVGRDMRLSSPSMAEAAAPGSPTAARTWRISAWSEPRWSISRRASSGSTAGSW